MDYSSIVDKFKQVLDILRLTNDYGIWSIAQFLILAVSFFIGLKLIYFPRRRIRNLNFNIRFVRNPRHDFESHIHLEFRNYTGRSVVLSSPFFRYRKLRPPTDAHGDTLSGEYEIKFPNPSGKGLTEVEYLLRNKESVHTIIPIDPKHSEEEVNAMHAKRRIGKLTVMCTWLQDRPKVDKLVRPI
ncbi:MAG TPA: hypothetical protein VLG68_04220 [Gammaproteobacteria bacterium]|nr:hypothetical protein [Gammaproteobacteria bacterium]